MAVDLPTITVTDAQRQRIIATFQEEAEDQGITITQAYRRWTIRLLVDRVLSHESRDIDEAAEASKLAALDVILAELPDPDTIT